MYYTAKEINKKYNQLIKRYNKGAYKFTDLVTYLLLINDGTQLMSEVINHAKNDY